MPTPRDLRKKRNGPLSRNTVHQGAQEKREVIFPWLLDERPSHKNQITYRPSVNYLEVLSCPTLPTAKDEIQEGKCARGERRRQKQKRAESSRVHGHRIQVFGKRTFRFFSYYEKGTGFFQKSGKGKECTSPPSKPS